MVNRLRNLAWIPFRNNVRENDKVLIISGLFQHIGNGPGTPYNSAWNYIDTNNLRADEFKSFDVKQDRIYIVFTNYLHRFEMEKHFMDLRKANKSKVITIRPQVSTFISDLLYK